MLGSSSHTSEVEDQDQDQDQDHHTNNQSSPSDLHPPPRLSFFHHCHLISTTSSSTPLMPSPSPSTSTALIHPRQLLITCADLISRSEFSSANRLLSLLSTDFASVSGDSIERLVFQFSKALSFFLNRHLLSPNPNPNPNPSNFINTSSTLLYSSYLTLNQVTPFVRFIHLTANQAILEAIEGYKAVHIIDMDIMHGVQWPPLLQAITESSATLGLRPPVVRITGAGRDLSLLEKTGDRLSKFAQTLGLEFKFYHLLLLDTEVFDSGEAVVNTLKVHRHDQTEEEAVAIHCGEYLHRLIDNYNTTSSLRRFLHTIKTLNPRVLTLGEREANHNHHHYMRRFEEALDHYGAVFDSLEATLPPQSQERVAVEEGWFGAEIKDVVGEGERRRLRHQKYETWEVLLRSSGFKSVALSPFSLSQAKLLLRLHYPSEGYQLQVFNNNCLLLGWKNRPLFSVSSWN